MAHLAVLGDLANCVPYRGRMFRERADLFAKRTEWLLSRYRFPRQILLDLCRDLSPLLEHETKRTKAIPVHIQVLSTLGFLATSTFQREVGDRFSVSRECKYRKKCLLRNGTLLLHVLVKLSRLGLFVDAA